MNGYLVAEEGPLTGLVISLNEGQEWILGRDPDEANFVLEDSRVSRRHVLIRPTEEGFVIENLSSTNPALVNSNPLLGPEFLKEGDLIQIGSTIFSYSTKEHSTAPEEEKPSAHEVEDLFSAHLPSHPDARWLLKVISGTNAGAEFSLEKNKSYIIGKDSSVADILFQDLSVSRRHAKISVDANELVTIEDLDSKNGVLVNGEKVEGSRTLASQDLVALGTTSFLFLDTHEAEETIYTPPPVAIETKEEALSEAPVMTKEEPLTLRNWKDLVISTRHLIYAGCGALILIAVIAGIFSLFTTEPVTTETKPEQEKIQDVLANYPALTFTFVPSTGKLFVLGHVITPVQKREALYLLKTLPFVKQIEENIVIDQLVWQSMNELLASNPNWQSITVSSTAPGKFIVRGYVTSSEELEDLTDYLNLNFPYLNKLDNQVVIATNLNTQVSSLLVQYGFGSVQFSLTDGELVLSGMVNESNKTRFLDLVDHFRSLRGIRNVKNFTVFTSAETSRIDLSSRYTVTGITKKGKADAYIMINSRIYAVGDSIDGFTITEITPSEVLLEKDGLKYKINYNLQ